MINLKSILFLFLLFFVNVSFASQPKLTEEQLVDYVSNQKVEYPHYELGTNFLSGNLVDKDFDKALFWLAQSSELESYDKADYLIAEMYTKGLNKSNKVNLNTAKIFYERAAKRNNRDAKLKLATYFLFDETLYNQKEGLYWLSQSMKDNNQTAAMLMYLLSLGKDDIKTLSKEIPLLKIRSDNRDHVSSFAMGYLYLSAKGVDRDLNKAKTYFLMSMTEGNIIAEIIIIQIDNILINQN